MVKNLLFLLCFLGNLSTGAIHDFHISKAVVVYSEPDQALQITLHMFLDDLEDALRLQGVDKLFLCTEKESEGAENELFKYIQQKLKFQVNEKELDYEFVGKEPSEDLQAVWCYLEITDIATIQEITVNNSILIEMFDDQKNIVNIVGPDKSKSFLIMTKSKISERVEF